MRVSVWQRTNAEYIEAEALADGLVDKLIWEAVEAHMASQGQGPGSFILWKKSHAYRQTDQPLDAAATFFLKWETLFFGDTGLFQHQK